jgi:hypothetical protein
LNPRTWIPEASALTPRPPKPLSRLITLHFSHIKQFLESVMLKTFTKYLYCFTVIQAKLRIQNKLETKLPCRSTATSRLWWIWWLI